MMKKLVFVALVGLYAAAPAYAGHGSIEETDTAIIVEYTGDAKDKAAEASTPAPATRAATEAVGRVAEGATPTVVAKNVAADDGSAKRQSTQNSSNREYRSQRRQLRRDSGRPDQDLTKLAPPPASTGTAD
jgi:hypothetical protein